MATSNLYIRPIPMNRFCPFRWHEVSFFAGGYALDCADFGEICNNEAYAMPFVNGDMVQITMNAKFNNVELLNDMRIGILKCCEEVDWEHDSSYNVYQQGVYYDPAGTGVQTFVMEVFLTLYTVPEGVFNFVLIDGAEQIRYVSNPFRNANNENWKCDTVVVYAKHQGLGDSWYKNSGWAYFPEEIFRFRIDAAFIDRQNIQNRTEYTRSSGTKRVQAFTQQTGVTLSLPWFDHLTHEAMAFVLALDEVHIGNYYDIRAAGTYQDTPQYKPDGEYTRENFNEYGLSNATVKLLEQTNVVKTGSC